MNIIKKISAALLSKPIVLTPLRLETRWDEKALHIRWYPDGSQLVLDRNSKEENINNTDKVDDFDDVRAFTENGFIMKAMPKKISLFTIGYFGGLESIMDVIISNPETLRFKWSSSGKQEDYDSNWVKNFNKAKECGMAVSIADPILLDQIRNAEWLIAFGYNRYNIEAIKDIFKYFIISSKNKYSPNQFRFLNYDEPTNNTIDEKVSPIDNFKQNEQLNASNEIAYTFLGKKYNTKLITNNEILSKYFGMDFLENNFVENGNSVKQWDLPLCARQLLFGNKHVDLIPGGYFPPFRINDNPYGMVMSYAKRWKYRNLRYALSMARMTGRTILNQNIAADEELLRFENVIPLIKESEYERLEASLGQQIRSFTIHLKEGDGKDAIDSLKGPFISLDQKKVEDVLDNLITIVENNLTLKEVKERVPSESRLNYILRRINHLFYRNKATLTNNKYEAGTPLLEFLLTNAAFNERKKGHAFSYCKALKILKYCISEKILTPEEMQSMLIETLDCYTFRFDAWFSLRAFRRLQKRISINNKMGIGVYGWIEKPMNDSNALFRDQTTDMPLGEFFQAPSIDQGKTVAALRSVSLSKGSNYQTNLSSDRVRDALDLIDSLRSGASLAEIFGYRVARLLHDKKMDVCINTLKTKLPTKPADSNTQTNTITVNPKLGIIDGEKFTTTSVDDIIKWLKEAEIVPCDNYKQEFESIKNRLSNIKDAFLDLAYSEVAYQYIKGNKAKAQAWLNVAAGKLLPPIPEFVQTQRTGYKISNRVFFLYNDGSGDIEKEESLSPLLVLEPNWEIMCRNILTSTYNKDSINLNLTVSRVDNPSIIMSFPITSKENNISILGLILHGEKYLDDIKEIVFTELLLMNSNYRNQLIQKCFSDNNDISDAEILQNISVQVSVCDDKLPFSGIQQKLSSLIKTGLPLLNDKTYNSEILTLLNIVMKRILIIKNTCEQFIKHFSNTDIIDFLKDANNRTSLKFISGFIPGNVLHELFITADSARQSELKIIIINLIINVVNLSNSILVGGKIVFEPNKTQTSKTPLFEFEINTTDGVYNITEVDKQKAGIWGYIFKYIQDISSRFQQLLNKNQNYTSPNISNNILPVNTNNWFMFLHPFSQKDEKLFGLIQEGDFIPSNKKEPFNELTKIRFVRSNMSNLFGIYKVGELYNNYELRISYQSKLLDKFKMHAEYAHKFTNLSQNLTTDNKVGFIVDNWIDFIPNKTETTSIVVNYDAPGAEAPNAFIICAPPYLAWTKVKMAKAITNVIHVMRLRTLNSTDVMGNDLQNDFRNKMKYTFEINKE